MGRILDPRKWGQEITFTAHPGNERGGRGPCAPRICGSQIKHVNVGCWWDPTRSDINSKRTHSRRPLAIFWGRHDVRLPGVQDPPPLTVQRYRRPVGERPGNFPHQLCKGVLPFRQAPPGQGVTGGDRKPSQDAVAEMTEY